MLARILVQLPQPILAPADTELVSEDHDVGGYGVRLYPPRRSRLASQPAAPVLERGHLLRPDPAPPVKDSVRMNGSEVIEADVLQIDFTGQDFERRRAAPPDNELLLLAFDIANGFLSRIRTLGRAMQLKLLSPEETNWMIEYLNDDESELSNEPDLYRIRGGSIESFRHVALSEALWDRARDLPVKYEPPQWDTLLLDAFDQLPHVGAAVVLGFTALETRIETALNVLARNKGVGEELWNWINDRGDYRKEPSTGEQYSVLLSAIVGSSLKDQAELWDAFRNLQAARNSFVHDGQPSIGGQIVSAGRAQELLQRAGSILDWVDGLLPEAERRPSFNVSTEFEFTAQLSAEQEEAE